MIECHCMTSHSVPRLLLMAPLDCWRFATPKFGKATFCGIKTDKVRVRSQWANVHSQYLHCPLTNFAHVLNAGSWRPKLFKNKDHFSVCAYFNPKVSEDLQGIVSQTIGQNWPEYRASAKGALAKGPFLLRGPIHRTRLSMRTNSLFMYFKNLLQQKFVAQITSSSHSSIVNDKNLQGQYPQITSSSHSSMVHC